MASRVRWKSYARFRAGENSEIVSKDYLSLLSYGCNGCDGEGVYAEILEFTKNVNDNIAAIIVEDADKTVTAGSNVEIVVYACPDDGAPIKLQAGQFEIVEDTGSNYSVNANKTSVDIKAGASGNFSVDVKAFGKTASANITIG